MKTAKKIFSLVLVAVLMLSAIPFQASATENDWYGIFWDEGGLTRIGSDVKIEAGKLASIPTPPTKAGKEFAGWTIGGRIVDLSAFSFGAGNMTKKMNGEEVAFQYCDIIAKYNDVCQHTNMKTPVRVEATCTADGSITTECATEGCNYKTVETLGKLGHTYGAWETVTEATHDHAGKDKQVCSACGDIQYRDVDQLTYTVTFYDINGNVETTKQWIRYQTVPTLPTPDEVLNKDFMGWYTAPTGGTKLEPGSEWSGSCTAYYARYEDSVHDGQSKINVYFRLYSEGVAQGQARKLTSFQVADYTSLASALNGKKAEFANLLAGYVDLSMYEITDGYYVYDPSTGKEAAMDSNAKVNGDNSVLIKLVANKSARATVMVFVHSKVEAAAAYTYTMAGYTTNDTVFETDVENLLKSKGKNYTVNGMFSDNMWERKLAGYTTDPVSALSIEDDGLNGVLKIHVLAPNFSAGTSKPADKTNPATGDTAMIEITAAVMLLSAAAVVTLTQLRKRKMI